MQKANLLTITIALLVGTTAPSSAKPTCEQIDAAISANEDYVEFALSGDAISAKTALVDISKNFGVVSASLPTQDRSLALEFIANIKMGNRSDSSLAAIENYKILASSFEGLLPTTLPSAMLDYAGFKLRAQAAAAHVDWAAVSATNDETSANWTKAKTDLSDKAVLDLGESIQAALAMAISAKNAKWLDSSAQILLDSVDLIERQIKNPAKGACR